MLQFASAFRVGVVRFLSALVNSSDWVDLSDTKDNSLISKAVVSSGGYTRMVVASDFTDANLPTATPSQGQISLHPRFGCMTRPEWLAQLDDNPACALKFAHPVAVLSQAEELIRHVGFSRGRVVVFTLWQDSHEQDWAMLIDATPDYRNLWISRGEATDEYDHGCHAAVIRKCIM